jgi:cell fate regulator YaaT (PSP1 superfamily)
MRQIGARQEAAKIGGLGSCGRELCCSTWKTDMVSVKTDAARKQNLSLIASKLAGQCGKLKCCLNYELETYLEAWDQFPAELLELETKQGILKPHQPDLLKGMVNYSFKDGHDQSRFSISIKQVKDYIAMNKKGQVLDTRKITPANLPN